MRHVTASTARLALVAMLTLPAAACVKPSAHGEAICVGLVPYAEAHGRNLLDPATPDNLVMTGEPLVLGLLAACK